MKSEKLVIDQLGKWLCRDMEKSLHGARERDGPLSTSEEEKIAMIIEVAVRIQYYRDNCINT